MMLGEVEDKKEPIESISDQQESSIKVEKGSRALRVVVPECKQGRPIFFDFYALIHGATHPTGKGLVTERVESFSSESESEPTEANGNEQEGPFTSTKSVSKKKRNKKKNDREDYDLGDPFIDDGDMPAEMSIFDMLANISPDEDPLLHGPDAVDDSAATIDTSLPAHRLVQPQIEDFYVWKGRLPELEGDTRSADDGPILLAKERKYSVKKNAGRSSRVKAKAAGTKKSKTGSSSTKKRKGPTSEIDRSELTADSQPKGKRSKKNTSIGGAATNDNIKEKKLPRKGKAKVSLNVLDRIAALGESERDDVDMEILSKPVEVEEGSVDSKPISKTPSQSALNEATGTDEKVRKRFDTVTPFLELELKLALENFQKEVQSTTFEDPKKFPSNLRPYCNEAMICCLRMQDSKNALPASLFDTLCEYLPFPKAAVGKMIYTKLVPYYRDELKAKLLPSLYSDLKAECEAVVSIEGPSPAATSVAINVAEENTESQEPKKKARLNDKQRALIFEIVRTELDVQALNRLYSLNSSDQDSSEPAKGGPYSEVNIRKTVYTKIVACWQTTSAGMLSTQDIGKEFSNIKRKIEMRKLKEHNIEVEPILIPIRPKEAKETSVTVPEPLAITVAEAVEDAAANANVTGGPKIFDDRTGASSPPSVSVGNPAANLIPQSEVFVDLVDVVNDFGPIPTLGDVKRQEQT